MKKIILSMLVALGCTTSLMAQTDDNALRINFTGTGNPIENEHLLEGTHITFSNDGEQMNLTVNNATVTYDLDNVSCMSHFRGTPSVALHANEDPDNEGNYYTTFYSGLEAYTIPSGVKAYSASIDNEYGENVVSLTRIEGDILPKGVAALLYSNTSGEMPMAVSSENGNKPEQNVFQGVDVATAQDAANYYMLSYGQNQLGFYRMNPSTMLAANKAFFVLSPSDSARALRMVFVDDEVDGISPLPTSPKGEEKIYNLNGMRMNKLQKGINIVNGKKVIVK